MRIAIISDIHGNLAALQAVLADIDARGFDAIINAGDTLGGPLASAKTADLLMARQIPMIAGNHERQVLTFPRGRMSASDACTDSEMESHHRAWLASAPATCWLTDDVFVCHGTPQSDLDYWLETVTPDFRPDGSPGVRAASLAEVSARLGAGPHAQKASLIICGHTHVPRVVRLPSASLSTGITVLNPGSVGLPAYDDVHPFLHHIQTGSPHARYASASRTPLGWHVELHSVPYDYSGMVELARSRGRMDWAHALETGFALPA